MLGLLLAGYLTSESLHFPVAPIADPAAVLLLLLARRSPGISVRRIRRHAPWRIVVFPIGMYVVVFGRRNAGLTALLATALRRVAAHGLGPLVFFAGHLAAFLSPRS